MSRRRKDRPFKGLDFLMVLPFLVMAGIWLVLSALGVAYWEEDPDKRGLAWRWLAVLWLLCLADLYALARATAATLATAAAEASEQRAKLSIQALFWGILKLGCLGLFTFVLIRHGAGIPSVGLLLGLGTLVVVPIVGGYAWSQRS